MSDLETFNEERECVFDGEHYSVRDNGSVLRHSRPDKRARAADNQWTFGKTNSSNAYLHIGDARVHRIVATAFHGEPKDPKMVVDHIDSNCRNNRPENLRWLTRLENTLLNPVTRKKIEYLCGSIEAFLENPSMLNKMNLEPNISWMRTVTSEEAQNCKMRMTIWSSSKEKPTNNAVKRRGTFASRAHKPIQKWEAGLAGEPGLDFARTPWCGQYFWGAPTYFPRCPEEVGPDPIDSYFQNLKAGEIFSYSDTEYEIRCPKLTVTEAKKTTDDSSIVVLCHREDAKPFAIAGISLNEKGFFIHFGLGSFVDNEAAQKAFADRLGLTHFWSVGYNSFG